MEGGWKRGRAGGVTDVRCSRKWNALPDGREREHFGGWVGLGRGALHVTGRLRRVSAKSSEVVETVDVDEIDDAQLGLRQSPARRHGPGVSTTPRAQHHGGMGRLQLCSDLQWQSVGQNTAAAAAATAGGGGTGGGGGRGGGEGGNFEG